MGIFFINAAKKSIVPLLLFAVALTGCGRSEAQPAIGGEDGVSIREAVTEAQPARAVQTIYEMLPDARPQTLSSDLFDTYFSGLGRAVAGYYGAISDPNGGLADVIILQLADEEKSNRDLAREALRGYQERRISRFENYDILDAFSIATGAEVFDQGDYVVLLMLPDNEAGREIIDRYMPL